MLTKISLLLFFIGSIIYSINGQTIQKSASLPSQKDWFLSTGDWGNDAQIYVTELGQGPRTILVLHGGWGAEHSGMKRAVNGLTDQFRFVFYDQRGSLRSPFPDSLITFDQHIYDIERLRSELNLEKLTIMAHSMGAVLASAYASKYPERIDQLILLAPAHLKNPLPDDDLEIRNEANQRFQNFMNRPAVNQEFKKFNLNRITTELSSQESTAIFRINFAKRMLYHIDKWSELSGGRALYHGHVFGLTQATYPKEGWNYLKHFQDANYKIDIIAGDHDFLDMGNHLIQKWTKEAKQLDLTIIKKAGHILWIDSPQMFKQSLQSILNK